MKMKEGIYTVAYAYPTSPNAVKMGRPQRGAWYIGYAKDRVTPAEVFKGPFDLIAQAEELLEDLHIGEYIVIQKENFYTLKKTILWEEQ